MAVSLGVDRDRGVIRINGVEFTPEEIAVYPDKATRKAVRAMLKRIDAIGLFVRTLPNNAKGKES